MLWSNREAANPLVLFVTTRVSAIRVPELNMLFVGWVTRPVVGLGP